MTSSTVPVAESLAPGFEYLLGRDLPVAFRFWDGSAFGPTGHATLVFRSARALRYLLWAPGELGLARAYVAGDIELEGDIYDALSLLARLRGPDRRAPRRPTRSETTGVVRALAAAGALGPPPPPPREEARLRGGRHSKARDAAAIAHHYDISNDFYRLVLGETMTYSCAYFPTAAATLDEAQRAKYDLVCRKLGLAQGMRLLDVGCGWGGMVLHAAAHYGVRSVGVTLSQRQAEAARARLTAAGLADRVEIRIQDYRDVTDGPYDAISSIGMFEHVGLSKLAEYFLDLRALLGDGGRLLNHGISRPDTNGGRTRFVRRSFIDRYVFPDGELHEVGAVISLMQSCGFEVRDVESLREHYARTLRQWVANLEENWDRCTDLVGPARARVWRLYMAASALNFAANRTSVHQVLGVRTAADGTSGMPATREELLAGLPARSGLPA